MSEFSVIESVLGTAVAVLSTASLILLFMWQDARDESKCAKRRKENYWQKWVDANNELHDLRAKYSRLKAWADDMPRDEGEEE
jgi:hypothetical protein